MKQEEEEAAAAAMLNPDKAPEVKIYKEWKYFFCFFFNKWKSLWKIYTKWKYFFSLQKVKIFVKNLHKVKFIYFISFSKSESGVLCTNSKWSRALTKNESLTEIILKVKKPDAPVDPAGQGNKSKEQVSESSMIDHLS